ncbi:D-Ala-D-Ala carboxypeptidase family metallohydrolase [Gallaecimonas pentaromativorans]|uniref:D-Ala-D-Ala carboxypeptidase family metallohydrolase n=1 Tax=Gallaecimonas pentaromativorans TaxID=584787 RepID=UPI003A904B4E
MSVPIPPPAGFLQAFFCEKLLGDLTNNFSRAEFACRCGCGLACVAPELVYLLQQVRDVLAVPIRVVESSRCECQDLRVGGAPGNRYRAGDAADIVAEGIELKLLADTARRVARQGWLVKEERQFVHIERDCESRPR